MRALRFISPLLLGIVMTIGVIIVMSRLSETVLLAAPAAAVIYVDVDASGAATGLSWTDAYTNLQDALAIALSEDQIWVAEGIYYPDEGEGQVNDSVTSTFTLKPDVAIYGGFDPDLGINQFIERDWETYLTILSGDIDHETHPDVTDANGVVLDVDDILGDNAYTVVFCQGVSQTTVLDGFTITAGSATEFDDEWRERLPGMENSSTWSFLMPLSDNDNEPGFTGGGMYNWDNSSPTLANLVFSGNTSIYHGGGLFIYDSSSPSLTNVKFYGNYSDWYGGGGVAVTLWSKPVLDHVTFENNLSSYGGGLYIDYLSEPIISNSLFFNNSAAYGGGIYASSSYLTMTNVTFEGNHSFYDGGGIFIDSCFTQISEVHFWGNRASNQGGGFFIYGGSINQIINAVFSGNRSSWGGGGMFINNGAIIELLNVTFTENDLNTGVDLAIWETDLVTITNSIFWGGVDDSYPQIDRVLSDLYVRNSLIQDSGGSGDDWEDYYGVDGGGNLDTDPLFRRVPDPGDGSWSTLEDNDYGDLRLQPGSPAIDAGTNTGCPSTDLDGNPRPLGPYCDMGAYEFIFRNYIFLPLVIKDP
jgi:predicted outer membrane repeat protein